MSKKAAKNEGLKSGTINKAKDEAQTIVPTKKLHKVKINKTMEKIKKHPFHFVTGVLIIILAVTSVALYESYNKTRDELKTFKLNSQTTATQDLVQNVANLSEVPVDETPTIATITDVNKLKDQVFFSRAENGDKLLIYSKSSRAILYRPTTNKIVEAMAVNIDNLENITNQQTSNNSNNENSEKQQTSNNLEEKEDKTKEQETNSAKENTGNETETKNEGNNNKEEVKNKVKVAIYNSTTTAGLAGSLSRRVETDFDEFEIEVIDVGDASGTYEQTTIVNQGNMEPPAVETLANYLNAKVGNLPEGESPNTEATLIIYIGKDY